MSTRYRGLDVDSTVSFATTAIQTKYTWPKEIFGLSLLGVGASRSAYSLPGGTHVLKIRNPHDGDGHSQISNEIKIYLMSPPALERHLAAILEFGEDWIIQERCSTLSSIEKEDRGIASFANSFEERPWCLRDVHLDNIGRRFSDNSLCVFDYGCGYGYPNFTDWR